MGTFRFILAILVVLVHSRHYPLGVLPDVGLVAVAVFFLISGYLMPCAFSQNYRARTIGEQLRSYLLSRLLRIFPLYWLSITLMTVALIAFGGYFLKYAIDNPGSIIKQYLLVGLNLAELWGSDYRLNGPAWTLDIEIQYYLLCPIMVLAWLRWPAATLAAIITAMAVGAYLRLVGSPIIALDRSLLSWWPMFAAGALCALYPQQARSFLERPIAILALAGSALITTYPILKMSEWSGFALTIVLSIGAVVMLRDDAGRGSPLDHYLGELSYPLYVFHTIVPSFNLPDRLARYAGSPGFFSESVVLDFLGNMMLALPLSVAAHTMLGRGIARVRQSLKSTAPVDQVPLVPILGFRRLPSPASAERAMKNRPAT